MPQVTIGADPEFGLLSRGALVHAENALTGISAGDATELGPDGSGRPVEVRPAPSENPIQVVANIRQVLRRGANKFPDLYRFKWKAGSIACTDPIGGHIHFGHPELKASTKLCDDITRLLNKTLTPIGVLIEDVEEARFRRLGTHYGSIEESPCRHQPWGFEYRVLASWLVSPRVAGGVLSIAKALVEDIVNDPEFRKKVERLPAVNVAEVSYPDRLSLAVLMPAIVNLLRSSSQYKNYRTYIETILAMIAYQKDWGAKRDMKDTWDIKPEPKNV